MSRRAVDWIQCHSGDILCAIGLAALYWIVVRRLVVNPMGYDESFFVWTGWSINRGLIPYREFVEYKPPVVFILNAIGLALFGFEHHRYRLVFVILTAAALLALMAALLRRGADRWLTFCALSLIQLALFAPGLHDSSLDDTETIGMAFYLLGLACLWWGGRRVDLANALGGAFLACAILSKEPYAPVALATWATVGLLNRSEQGISWRRYALRSGAGAAAVGVTLVSFLAITRALPAYRGVMREYFGYTSRIGCLRPTSLAQFIDVSWEKLSRSLVTPDLLGGFVPFMIAFAVLSSAKLNVRAGVVLSVLASWYAVTIGGCFFRHYFIMGLAGPFLWGCLGAIALSQAMSGAARPLVTWIRLAAVAALLVQYGPRLNAELTTTYKSSQLDLMGVPAPVIQRVQQLTSPDDFVFTDGMPAIYLATNRRRATRQSYFLDELIDSYPGRTDAERLAPIRADLAAHRPKVIYLDPANAARKRRTRAALLMPFIADFSYKPVMENLYVRP